MVFDLPKDESPIIKVLGVGGGGSNAVTHMFKQGIVGVDGRQEAFDRRRITRHDLRSPPLDRARPGERARPDVRQDQ